MTRRVNHALLDRAKLSKRDEFYTLYTDIERELQHYTRHFMNKTVYCNCDDPRTSNFCRYFTDNFTRLGLRRLICSCYRRYEADLFSSAHDGGFYRDYTGHENSDDITRFVGNGDFRSHECIELLRQSDIVVTNPPFSLFREYLRQLTHYGKKFLIISNINAITYKEIFTLIQSGEIWLGVNFGRGISGFIVPEDYPLYGTETRADEHGNHIISPNNCLWLTNLDSPKRHEFIPLTKTYRGHESEYPFYDNYPAINIDSTRDIPADFAGTMGVPVTFLHKHSPEQFEILGFRKGNDGKDLRINGRSTYFRILIRNKQL
ncbi:MAG: adenine-specific methyltransferase EcoRI family protein [Synergistaceae bacterium]|nr:adenine-specific methyltransferase EcoRI family protein [Synergistaceae bacterium]